MFWMLLWAQTAIIKEGVLIISYALAASVTPLFGGLISLNRMRIIL